MGFEYTILIFFTVVALGIAVVAGILAAVALSSMGSLQKEVARLRGDLAALYARTRDVVPEPRVSMPPPPLQPVMTPAARAAAEAATARAVAAATEQPPSTIPPRVAAYVGAVSAASGGSGMGGAGRTVPAAGAAGGGAESLESKIGRRWIAWVGAVVVFFSAVFFLKYAFDNAWIGPTGQVAICATVGAALLATGSRFAAKGWRIFGQALLGLGLGILYATFFAAFSVYETPVMGQQAAFACMVLVTLAGMTLALLHDAVSTAFLAVLGGFLTPVLLSTGHDARDALFTYLLLLDLGVLGVALFRGWRLLDTLALVGTIVLYMGWYGQFYKPEGMAPALAWLGAFYLVFLVLPFAFHLVRKQEVTIERFIMALANALFAAAYAWYTLNDKYLFAMGFVALGMAGAYLALGAAVRARLPGDARALFGLLVMAVTFLTLAVPMELEAEGILLAWVAEAPVLLFLAYQYRYPPVRTLAGGVLVLAIGRLFFWHWPLHDSQTLYVLFFNRHFLSAILVPVAMAVFAGVHQAYRGQGTDIDRGIKLAVALAAGFLALVIVHAELGGWLEREVGTVAADSAVAALWALGAGGYLWAGTRVPRTIGACVWAVGVLTLAVAGVLGLMMYGDELGKVHVLFANARFGAGLLAVAAVAGYAGVTSRRAKQWGSAEATAATIFLIGGLVWLLALLSTEVYTYCTDTIEDWTKARRAGQMSITLVWSLYAAGLLVAGFAGRWRAVRIGGLALFGVAALKLVLVDLTYLSSIYRIVSFLALGLAMLVASYLYHRLEKRLGEREPGARSREPEGTPPTSDG